MPRIEAYRREMEKRPPSKARSDLIDRVVVATGSGELNTYLVESTVLATALGINAAQPVQNQVPAEVVRKHIKLVMPDLARQSEQSVNSSMHYTYHTVSDRDLEAYLKFLNSPGGAAFTKAAVEGIRDAMNDALGRYMQAIPKALVKQGQSVGT
jgi:hypothetical protein